jgi:phosphatidylethanolamine/phosphatidyl-N-methylethanolamine N-methyltransferase
VSRLSDYQTFLTQFLRNYETTGSVIPSGRALGNALCRYVGSGQEPQKILEAGPGTGAVTGCIIDRMRDADELWMVELNPTFAAHLRSAFNDKPAFREAASRCHLIEGSVAQLGPLSPLSKDGQFDLIISGLPLNNFSSADVQDILQAYAKLLKPGGILSFFQYILIRPAKMFVSLGPERDRLKGVGEAIEGVLGEREFAREWVWVNVPPAWVHHIRF